jgi:DNA-directed RNA polymerase specialized sigma24 family protein
MSGQQRSKKAPARGNPQRARKTGDPIADALQACTQAQAYLTKTEELARQRQEARRQAIRQAFAAGASAQEIANAVQISRAKIYQLIGSARQLKSSAKFNGR